MNLGQFLTAKSPLPSGTVAQHLAAIAASVGTGTGETVFASMFSVQIDQPSITVTRRAKRSVQGVQADTKPTRNRESPDKLDGAAYALSRRHDLTVWTGVDEMTVLSVTTSMSIKTQLTGESITRKRVRSAIKSSN